MGNRCLMEIRNDLPDKCIQCNTKTRSPMVHYIAECEATGSYINRRLESAEDITEHTSHSGMATLVQQYIPPRCGTGMYLELRLGKQTRLPADTMMRDPSWKKKKRY